MVSSPLLPLGYHTSTLHGAPPQHGQKEEIRVELSYS
jgi:hypothetical protein